MLYTHIPPPHQVCDSPDQRVRYHTVGPRLGGSTLTGISWSRNKGSSFDVINVLAYFDVCETSGCWHGVNCFYSFEKLLDGSCFLRLHQCSVSDVVGINRITYVRADEPMARMPKVARNKILLTRGIHCCPNFFRPISLYYEVYMYYIYDGVEIVYDYHYYQMML
jgi:hypothetical protein